MKLIIVRNEKYDCYDVGVAHPVEFESKETLVAEYENKMEQEFKRLKELWPEENHSHRTRRASIILCGLLLTREPDHPELENEFYTIDEWFEKYKDFDTISEEEISKRDKKIEEYSCWVISQRLK